MGYRLGKGGKKMAPHYKLRCSYRDLTGSWIVTLLKMCLINMVPQCGKLQDIHFRCQTVQWLSGGSWHFSVNWKHSYIHHFASISSFENERNTTKYPIDFLSFSRHHSWPYEGQGTEELLGPVLMMGRPVFQFTPKIKFTVSKSSFSMANREKHFFMELAFLHGCSVMLHGTPYSTTLQWPVMVNKTA